VTHSERLAELGPTRLQRANTARANEGERVRNMVVQSKSRKK
jgi:hypothetical protein